jgi:short-subunit dehydrogenase
MRTLEGKRVLITGGGGGLGRALAVQFADAGGHVIVADLDDDAAKAVARDVKNAIAYRLDVTDPADVKALRDRIAADGSIDVLVNNAGVVFGGPFVGVALRRHIQTVAVNLTGVLTVTHTFLNDLLTRPEAHVVNIASASAFIPLPHGASYAASKWAVLGFTESLRDELRLLGHQHVGVTAVCPSYIDTGLFAGAKPPRLTRWLTADEVADETVRAVFCNRPVVLLPRRIRFLLKMGGLLPRASWRRLLRRLGVATSMTGWHGRHGNL